MSRKSEIQRVTLSSAIELVYPEQEIADNVYQRAQAYMRARGLSFVFLESGELVTNEETTSL